MKESEEGEVFIESINPERIGSYEFTVRVTARGGAQREDAYTLVVGCEADYVKFRAFDGFNDKIDLYLGDDINNIYQIQPFEIYSSYDMPDGLECEIEKYEIVESSAVYLQPEYLQINEEYESMNLEYPILLQ